MSRFRIDKVVLVIMLLILMLSITAVIAYYQGEMDAIDRQLDEMHAASSE